MATYEPVPRRYQASAQVASKVLLYSGSLRTQDDSVQNRERLQSVAEVYDPRAERWESKECTGEAPVAGLYNAAFTSSNDALYAYGGRDGDRQFVNSLHQLSVKTYQWSKRRPRNEEGECPMPKCGVAMAACGDNLALLGGFGLPHGTIQSGSSFLKKYRYVTNSPGWTNEFHIYCLKEDVWSSPVTTGDRPPPCDHLSLTSIDHKRAVMFGGHNGKQLMMNDVYIIDLQSMNWTKLNKSGDGPWPEGRSSHAACCLNYGQKHPQLLVTGGVNKEGIALGDAWILDVDSGRWRKVNDTLQPRKGHSAIAIGLGPGLTEVIMFGGEDRDYGRLLADTTVLQFRLKGDSWELSGVVGPTELGQSEERLREKMEYRFNEESWKLSGVMKATEVGQLEDRLRGKMEYDIYKRRSFTYTGKDDQLLWKDYGIELHFPSTSDVHIDCAVSVLSTDDDNYIFPVGSELVSAVYDISTNKPFPEPVTVRLQHCIPIDSEKEASELTFVIADTAQGPPYKFRPLSGGSFRCGSSYAEIQLTHFSMPAIIRWCRWVLGRPITFSASIFYLPNNMASFTLTKNLQAHITAIKDFYNSALQYNEFPLMIDRHSTKIELMIPPHPTWEVISHITPPKIDMAAVWEYQPGKVIPQITMKIKWKEMEEQPNDSYVTLELGGVHGQASLRLLCTHYTTPSTLQDATTHTTNTPLSHPQSPTSAPGTHPNLIELLQFRGREREINIAQEVGTHYRQFGIFLLKDSMGSRVNNIVHTYHNEGPESINMAILQEWMDGKGVPLTWEALVKTLECTQLTTLAMEIRNVKL